MNNACDGITARLLGGGPDLCLASTGVRGSFYFGQYAKMSVSFH